MFQILCEFQRGNKFWQNIFSFLDYCTWIGCGKSLKNNKTPSNIASEIIQLAKGIKTNRIEVAVSYLLPCGDKMFEKVKKVKIHLQEKCTAENLGIIQHTNIKSKLDLFPDKSHANKQLQGIWKGNFRRFVNDFKFWCFSLGDGIVTQNSNIPLNATRNIGNASCSSLLVSSQNSEEKDP